MEIRSELMYFPSLQGMKKKPHTNISGILVNEPIQSVMHIHITLI